MKLNYLLFFSAIIVFFTACTKISTTEIGTGLVPPVDGVNTKDTFINVTTKNVSIDTIRPSLFDDHVIGYINDPLFGTTNAAINVQMQPAVFPFTFETSSANINLDSVVLVMAYHAVWGDSTQPLTLHVKELTTGQVFDHDTAGGLPLYNNASAFLTASELTYNGSAIINPLALNDSVKAFTDTTINQLRIRLSDDFGNRLIHTYDTNSVYKNDTLFRAAFKGFQISADAAGNSLISVGLASSSTFGADPNTKLALYYHYVSGSTKDTSVVKYFTINTSTSAHSNFIKRDLSTGQAGSYFPPTAALNDDYAFIEASPGTFATVTIDSQALVGLPNLVIHRAELLMDEAPDDANPLEKYFTPPFLFLLAKDDTSKFNIPGVNEFISSSNTDAIFSPSAIPSALVNYVSFGGIPHTQTGAMDNAVQYVFNISRYIQGIVTNKNKPYPFVVYTPYKETFRLYQGNNSFYGYVSSSPPNTAAVGRVRLFGGSADVTNQHRMRLHIIYSIPH